MRKQEKEERQIEESRLMMKQEESEDATLSRDAQGQQEALAENKGEKRCNTGDVIKQRTKRNYWEQDDQPW